MSVENKVIQYVPFSSFVHPSFWHTLSELKLETDRLDETEKEIHGRYTFRGDIGPVFEVDGTSFNREPYTAHLYENVSGTLMNKNTIEKFKNIDKAQLLNSVGERIWNNIKKSWIENPKSLLNFIILSFADLKKFNYYYWFAFPSPNQPTVYLKESKNIASDLSNKQMDELSETYKSLDAKQRNFYFLTKYGDSINVSILSDILTENAENHINLNSYFVFTDPSNGVSPGWPLRIFIAALLEHCPFLCGSQVQFLGQRCNANGDLSDSRIFTIKVPQNIQKVVDGGWVGWERNDKGNFGPKLAKMGASMDPIQLADASSDLNIKLMKWRLVPDINVELMKSTKCLLMGSGTLGCHVARNLLAWGFRHITLLDNGKVSYSNPTRQVLFNHQDCYSGGRYKAEAAAKNLKLILPSITCRGIVSHIPMPGHPVGESLKAETITNIKNIIESIIEHDVIFLLLDTREARWLPTLIGALYGKIVINAALGFDSYLVMRHGVSLPPQDEPVEMSVASLPGGQLGCYFCNDVTAPGNSLRDRTLDQQCTVTRPGVAAIAGALAVELLVALLQHPLRVWAPAVYNLSEDIELPPKLQGVLGPVPHSIRGFLHSYHTVTPTCAKFKQCIACSEVVINKYKESGEEFLLNVFNSGTYLEEVTGLAELHLAAEMTEVLILSDEED